MATHSTFSSVPEAPADPILGVNSLFIADPHPQKVNLSVGAYRDDNGRPLVLSAVRKAESQMLESKLDKEYLPIDGLKDFNKATAELIFGASHQVLQDKRVVTVQALSGTGAVRLALEFVRQFFPPGTAVYIPNPTWSNHNAICEQLNVPQKLYRYFHAATNGVDFDGLLADLSEAAEGSIVLLHGCAHNPTGSDPTREQWHKIAELMKARRLFPFFDVAYQGFASGDVDEDAYSVRYFAKSGFELFVAQSYAKNLGLYAERVGALNVVLSNPQNTSAVLSQLKVLARRNYSNPPVHGARIATLILNNPQLRQEWLQELKGMADRIKGMRQTLFDSLKAKSTPGDWSHILNQIGMFSYTGLSAKQCELMISKYHIYLLKNGRISMAGLNSSNVEYVATAIHDAVTHAHL